MSQLKFQEDFSWSEINQEEVHVPSGSLSHKPRFGYLDPKIVGSKAPCSEKLYFTGTENKTKESFLPTIINRKKN